MAIKFDPYDAEKSLFSAQKFAIYVTPDEEMAIYDFTYRFIEAGTEHYRDACRGLELYTDLALYGIKATEVLKLIPGETFEKDFAKMSLIFYFRNAFLPLEKGLDEIAKTFETLRIEVRKASKELFRFSQAANGTKRNDPRNRRSYQFPPKRKGIKRNTR